MTPPVEGPGGAPAGRGVPGGKETGGDVVTSDKNNRVVRRGPSWAPSVAAETHPPGRPAAPPPAPVSPEQGAAWPFLVVVVPTRVGVWGAVSGLGRCLESWADS